MIRRKKNESPSKRNSNGKQMDNHDDSIIIKVSDPSIKNNTDISSFNPLELLLGQLGKMHTNTQKEIIQEIDSDEEYDSNAPIYDETNEQSLVNDENFVELPKKIENINDLIELGTKYEDIINTIQQKKANKKHKKTRSLESEENVIDNGDNICELYELDGKKYGVNLEIVSKLSKPLNKLSKMIGMKKVKDDIFEMIIYFLQGFEKNNKNMLHSVIEGPPGVGKTKLGKIMAQIYCALGIIPSSKFKYVKATDLIGDHVGATKHMTQNAIDEADGGVLFIDEAYALSSNENKDPYGKECIDTLNFNLSENKKKLIVIIAGYPDYLDKYFFSFNPGLQRRFPFKFRIDSYTAEELRDIFIDKLRKFKWKFNKNISMEKITEFFKTNKDCFPNFGGDIENLFKSCQFAHSKRMIGKHPVLRGKLIFDDILIGFDKFKKNKREDTSKPIYPHMYT
jgi:SpoVK/Ycf46/Vps4 family AAA+-type ATPase